MHKLDLHANQLGKYRAGISGLMALLFWLAGCPGPGSSWGDLTVPPPSKEGESPSNLVLLVRIFLSIKAGQDYGEEEEGDALSKVNKQVKEA